MHHSIDDAVDFPNVFVIVRLNFEIIGTNEKYVYTMTYEHTSGVSAFSNLKCE